MDGFADRSRPQEGSPPMLKIPVVVWIANAAARWTGSYGDVTDQARDVDFSRQTQG
jgi:hypothetical protein